MTETRRTGTAVIAGGSLAGLFVANILHRAGWRVSVHERVAAEMASRGAGIATHDDLLRALDRAGAAMDAAIGVEVTGRTAYDAAGDAVARFPYRQFLTSWSLLYRRLREALPDRCYVQGADVVGVVQDSGGAALTLADGTEAAGSVAIGADGIWSTIGQQLSPTARPTYCGYVAWRGMIDEERFSDAFRQRYFGTFNFAVLEREQFVGYPVAGSDGSTEPGKRRFNFLWYRPADPEQELPDLLTDGQGGRNPLSIAPNLIRADHVERLRAAARRLLPPDFADAVDWAPAPFLQPIYDHVSPRIAFGRVALIGDAAFVARPHVGMGVAKAAVDAVTLAEALIEGPTVVEAVALYQSIRLPYGKAAVAHGRHLGAFLESRLPGGARTAAPAPAHVIRQSAMPLTALS